MKVVKLTDRKLNEIIHKVIKEQEEEQFASTGPAPEEISGSPEDESGDPDYAEFIDAAKTLLSQGITIGSLVDKLLEAREPEETEELPTEPESDSGIPTSEY